MTSPQPTIPRPNSSTDPPRRSFGTKPPPPPLPRPTSTTTSSYTSQTQTHLVPPPPEPTRTRSASGASSDAFAWLSGWAPKGEGRSREFLTSTLHGVVNVAGTVGTGIKDIGAQLDAKGRRESWTGTSPVDQFAVPMSRDSSASVSPPNTATTSTPNLPSTANVGTIPGRRIPQPANLARLGAVSPSTPIISPPSRPNMPQSNSTSAAIPGQIPRTTSGTLTATLNGAKPHTPSLLSPHVRSASTSQVHPNHTRSSSFGLAQSVTNTAGSPFLSRSSSTANGGGPPSVVSLKNHGMPYKVGFQPAGVKKDRTEEYQDERRRRGEDREKEEGRLARRWAKLVDLHFNPTIPQFTSLPTLSRSPSSSISLSSTTDKRRSILTIDGALDALKPKEKWKGLKGAMGPVVNPNAEEQRKRAAEQAVVKWEDDGEVKKCRICQSSFNLATRKHHCRLCGRIVCSLPPTPSALLAVQIQLFSDTPTSPSPSPSSLASSNNLPPGTRREKCSLLLVADWKSGRGEEVEEGFVGWMKLEDPDAVKRASGSRGGSGSGRSSRVSMGSIDSLGKSDGGAGDERVVPLPKQATEVQVRGVRVCRDCWGVVSRKQRMVDRSRTTPFARLYAGLRSLQADITETMPEFEEAMEELISSSDSNIPKEILQMHKHLVTLFAQYEHLSKRISSLPAEEGSSQATVQGGVARSAAGFLGREMIKLQALPKFQKRAAEQKRRAIPIVETTLSDQLNIHGNGGEEVQGEDPAVILQPLLEQEAQLEVMISDANAQRKYEDSKALGDALGDIRAEIARITRGMS